MLPLSFGGGVAFIHLPPLVPQTPDRHGQMGPCTTPKNYGRNRTALRNRLDIIRLDITDKATVTPVASVRLLCRPSKPLVPGHGS